MKIPRLILSLLIVAPALHADSIALKNGTMVEGKYIATGPNGTTITYEANGQTHTVPRGDIQSIVLERNGKTEVLPGFAPPKPAKWQYVPNGDDDGGDAPGNYVRQPRRSHPHRYRQNRYGDQQEANGQAPANAQQAWQGPGPAPMNIDAPMGKPGGPAPMPD